MALSRAREIGKVNGLAPSSRRRSENPARPRKSPSEVRNPGCVGVCRRRQGCAQFGIRSVPGCRWRDVRLSWRDAAGLRQDRPEITTGASGWTNISRRTPGQGRHSARRPPTGRRCGALTRSMAGKPGRPRSTAPREIVPQEAQGIAGAATTSTTAPDDTGGRRPWASQPADPAGPGPPHRSWEPPFEGGGPEAVGRSMGGNLPGLPSKAAGAQK